MSFTVLVYFVLPISSFFACLILGIKLLRRYRVIGSREFAYVLLLSSAWALFNVFEHLDIQNTGLFWARISRIPISLIPVLWLLFTVNYSHQKNLIPDTIIAFLLIIPFLTNVFLWLPATQHFVWSGYVMRIVDGLSFFETTKGGWFWIYFGYLYGLIFVGAVTVILRLANSKTIFRKQALGILGGLVLPIIANIIYQFHIYPFFVDDLTATFLGLAGLITYLFLNQTKLFDLLPEPPTAVFESSLDGILILDHQYRILAANRAAKLFLSSTGDITIGSSLESIMPQWTDYLARIQSTTDQEQGYIYLRGERILEIRLVLLNNKSIDSEKKMLFIRDETLRLQAQYETEINQKKYQALYENMLNGVIIFHTEDDGETFRLQTLNQYALENLNLKLNDVIQQKVEDVFTNENFKVLCESLTQVRSSFEPAHLPTIKTHENGNYNWREFSLYRFSNTEVIALYQDITEEMCAKEKLSLTNSELENYVEQLEKFSTEVLVLNQFGQQLQTCLDYEDTAQTIHSYTNRLFSNQKIQLLIFDLFHETFIYSDYGENSEFIDDFLNNELIKTLPYNSIREFSIQDFESQKIQLKQKVKNLLDTPYLFYVCRFGNEKLVLLILENSTPGMSQKHRQHLSSIFERVVLTLSNIDLKEQLIYQALHDETTGFYNRRYLADYLPREIHRAERYHHNLSLIMLDVDYFKHFNDSYGHLLGDFLLEKISSVISSLLRKSDLSFRYGGEEFLLVLPETTLEEAELKAQTICEAISNLVIDWQGTPLEKITISGGVSSYPEHTQVPNELTRQADLALYQAKENGRNQIKIYTPSIVP